MPRVKQLILGVAFVAEVGCLLVGSALIARFVLSGLGLDRAAADHALLDQVPPQWAAAALAMAVMMIVRWSVALGAAELISRRRNYSIVHPVDVEGRWPIGRAMLLGVAVGMVLYLPSALTRYYHFEIAPVGQTPPLWPIIYTSSWTGGFWLFMAVSSFFLVPIVEEAFFRGYVLGRLHRLYTPRTAIIMSAILFAAVHGQYLKPDAFSLFNSAMVLVGGLALAWLVVKTRTLVPALLEHGYANTPHPLTWIGLDIAAATIGAVTIWILLRGRQDGLRPSRAAEAT